MRIIRIVFLLFALAMSCSPEKPCKSYGSNYIPPDLDAAIEYLDCVWDPKQKETFRRQPEQEAVVSLHFSLGLALRNDWQLWKAPNPISTFFTTRGITHPDDMTSIIFTSLHRKLHGRAIQLPEQIKYYQAYWEKMEQEEQSPMTEEQKKFLQETDSLLKEIP